LQTHVFQPLKLLRLRRLLQQLPQLLLLLLLTQRTRLNTLSPLFAKKSPRKRAFLLSLFVEINLYL
jgi:hypothetical protein